MQNNRFVAVNNFLQKVRVETGAYLRASDVRQGPTPGGNQHTAGLTHSQSAINPMVCAFRPLEET